MKIYIVTELGNPIVAYTTREMAENHIKSCYYPRFFIKEVYLHEDI